ncbi:hypothetical protein AX15_005666 [Amanita polypyramis BW_CC]|nr:hypothetical protein AX15_005666 [Amanita polypyramis BW_CC]
MSPSKTRPTPRHWPDGVQYIDSYCYHASVTAVLRRFIQDTPSQGPGNQPASSSSLCVTIRFIPDTSHPARGQHGLFAVRKIPPKSHIIDYMGELHCDDRPESNYDLLLHRFQDGISIGIDARVMGNEARFINDYRGIRNRPNALFVDAKHSNGELRMSIWSSNEEIRKGEEIVVSYGKSWWYTRR